MGEDNNRDVDLLKQAPDEMRIKEHRAAFYQLLAKSDSVTKVYNKTAVIDINDIYELNERITEKLRQYNQAGFIIQTNVKFSDGKTKTFPDWISLCEHKWYESESIVNMTITWEFNAIFPDMQVPQRHTLMVKLSNGLKPEEMINLLFTGKIEEIEELDQNLFPIVARVDFVERILADELLNIVGEWIKTLRDSPVKKSSVMLFLKRHKGKICSLLNWVTNIVVMFTSVCITGHFINSLKFDAIIELTKEQIVAIVYIVFGCAAVWIFGKKIIGGITDYLFEKLREYGENALFDITKGDHNKQARMKARESVSRLAVLGNLVVTIVINILCGIAVNVWF